MVEQQEEKPISWACTRHSFFALPCLEQMSFLRSLRFYNLMPAHFVGILSRVRTCYCYCLSYFVFIKLIRTPAILNSAWVVFLGFTCMVSYGVSLSAVKMTSRTWKTWLKPNALAYDTKTYSQVQQQWRCTAMIIRLITTNCFWCLLSHMYTIDKFIRWLYQLLLTRKS